MGGAIVGQKGNTSSPNCPVKRKRGSLADESRLKKHKFVKCCGIIERGLSNNSPLNSKRLSKPVSVHAAWGCL